MKQARWTIGAAILGTAMTLSATPALAKGFKVGPGLPYTSIQAAIDAASAGDKILVMAGTYTEPNSNVAAVTIDKPLKLMAKGVVTIVPGAGQLHGILAEGTESTHIDGLQIKGFTVQGFPKNGIWLRYVDNYKLESNTSIDNLENGIWPTLSAFGSVRRNVAYGSDDSALWVEASSDVRVSDNVLSDSVTGMEVTISKNIAISKNDIHDNTVGVGLYHPNGAGMDSPYPLDETGYWTVADNHIHENNRANSASPTSLAGSIPSGGGVLILGVDHITVDANLIENNNFYGIAVVEYCLAVDGSGNACSLNPPLMEAMPEAVVMSGNTLINNGTNPVAHPLAEYAADLTYMAADVLTPTQYKTDPFAKLPYGKNLFCGNQPSTRTIGGLGGSSLVVMTKC